eukprot:gene27142-33825_t
MRVLDGLTIGSHLSNSALTIISGFIVYPASCAKDVGILSVFSMAGLLCLVAGVMSIILYGFYEFGSQSWADPLTASTNYNNDKNLVLWPITLTDATSYVGVATFCFGLCSLAFPVEESMTHRKQFGTAVLWSLIFVWSVYFLLGDLGALLYAQDPTGIKQNILSNLPEMSTAASVVKLSMAGFCLLTFPLTCVVPAEMIERSILHLYNKATGNKPDSARPAKSLLSAAMTTQTNYQSVHTVKISDEENLLAIGNSSSGKGGSSSGGSSSGESGVSTLQTASSYQIETVTEEPSVLLRCVNRLAIVVISTVVAICIPCFGVVVSLIGCFTVTILSFILPAYLHLQLVTRPQLQLEAEQRQEMEMLISEGDAMHPRLVELSTVKTRTTKEIKVQSDGTLDVTETVDRGRARTMSNSVLPALQMDGYRSILHISNSSQYYVDIALVAVGVLLCIVATTMTSLDAWSKLQAGALC